jgi:hypothetical protein
MTIANTIRAFVAAATVVAATVAGAAAASADDFQRWVYINNIGNEYAIEAVHVSHVDDLTWGPNLINGYDIFPGEYVEVTPITDDGYCSFDVLLVLDDGYEMVLPGVNLCEATDIYTDGYDYDVQYI